MIILSFSKDLLFKYLGKEGILNSVNMNAKCLHNKFKAVYILNSRASIVTTFHACSVFWEGSNVSLPTKTQLLKIYFCSWTSEKYYLTSHLIMFGPTTFIVSILILRFVCAYIWHLRQYPILLFISDIRAFIWQCLPPRPTHTVRFGKDKIDRTDWSQEKH